MLRIVCIAFLFASNLLLTNLSSGASPPERFSEPDKIVAELTGFLVRGESKLLARRVSKLVGTPEQLDSIERAFSYIDGKKADYSDALYDKVYGTSLRRIVVIAGYSDLTFLYVRYTFKRTGTGWILTNYDFKTELQDMFPPGYAP